jgi:hypothetical protein
MAAGTTGELPMSVQPPAAPHRVAIADIQVPFWRLVAFMIKWMFAAIPALIIFTVLCVLIWIALIGSLASIFGILGNIPGVKL